MSSFTNLDGDSFARKHRVSDDGRNHAVEQKRQHFDYNPNPMNYDPNYYYNYQADPWQNQQENNYHWAAMNPYNTATHSAQPPPQPFQPMQPSHYQSFNNTVPQATDPSYYRKTPPLNTQYNEYNALPHSTPMANSWQPTSSVMFTPDSDQSFGDSRQLTHMAPESFHPVAGIVKSVPRPIQSVVQVLTHPEDELLYHKLIDGRLPMVGRKSKLSVSVGELKRRCGEPERMNKTTLALLLRQSKTKNNKMETDKWLSDNGIEILPHRRQDTINALSPFLEQEVVHLANDLKNFCDQYFPTANVANSLLRTLLGKGNSPQKCLTRLQNSVLIVSQLVKSLEVRQPRVTGMENRVKNNALDEKYETFSAATHGFGHANSLDHYRMFLKVFQQAAQVCEQLLYGFAMKEKNVLQAGENPWLQTVTVVEDLNAPYQFSTKKRSKVVR